MYIVLLTVFSTMALRAQHEFRKHDQTHADHYTTDKHTASKSHTIALIGTHFDTF